jgi:hypothetical protein
MIEFFKILAQRAGDKLMQNPTMKLGQDIMAGNAGQGFQDFAQKQYGPAMQMGQSLLNPEATMAQRADAVGNVIFGDEEQRRRVRPVGQPQLQPMDMAQPMQPVGGRPTTSRMQISQGLPQGILPYMMG